MRWFAALGIMALLVSCGPEGRAKAFPESAHSDAAEHGVVPVDAHAAEGAEHGPAESDTHAADATNPIVSGVLRTVRSAPVVGFEGPEGKSFGVALRTPEVGHYPCTGCHVRPIGSKDISLAQMHGNRAEHQGASQIECNFCHNPNRPGALILECALCHEREGVRELMPSTTAHLTVSLSHPNGRSGRLRNCFTCHNPENPGTLVLQDGSTASLDEAYRLCAGCHFMQAEDWAGGAHGKRFAGWQGDRVILSCTGCHNPHSPLFPIRKPVTFPKIARREASGGGH